MFNIVRHLIATETIFATRRLHNIYNFNCMYLFQFCMRSIFLSSIFPSHHILRGRKP